MQVVRWTSPTGTRRVLTLLDPDETTRYRRVTALALPRPPPSRAFGFGRPPGRPWHEERAAWRTAVRVRSRIADAAVVSDVASCYPSIGVAAIRRAAAWAGGDADPLLAFLGQTWQAGSGGLPVGPPPSALIADVVLSIADAHARAAGLEPIRWVDDVVFVGDRGAVARAERAWALALRELGLCAHEGKRRAADPAADRVGTSLTARPQRVIMRGS